MVAPPPGSGMPPGMHASSAPPLQQPISAPSPLDFRIHDMNRRFFTFLTSGVSFPIFWQTCHSLVVRSNLDNQTSFFFEKRALSHADQSGHSSDSALTRNSFSKKFHIKGQKLQFDTMEARCLKDVNIWRSEAVYIRPLNTPDRLLYLVHVNGPQSQLNRSQCFLTWTLIRFMLNLKDIKRNNWNINTILNNIIPDEVWARTFNVETWECWIWFRRYGFKVPKSC